MTTYEKYRQATPEELKKFKDEQVEKMLNFEYYDAKGNIYNKDKKNYCDQTTQKKATERKVKAEKNNRKKGFLTSWFAESFALDKKTKFKIVFYTLFFPVFIVLALLVPLSSIFLAAIFCPLALVLKLK